MLTEADSTEMPEYFKQTTRCNIPKDIYLLTPWSRFLLEKLTGFEPESSLPYSQVSANCPYPEPAPSSPNNPLPLPKDHS
jgi:hypothetical protein